MKEVRATHSTGKVAAACVARDGVLAGERRDRGEQFTSWYEKTVEEVTVAGRDAVVTLEMKRRWGSQRIEATVKE